MSFGMGANTRRWWLLASFGSICVLVGPPRLPASIFDLADYTYQILWGGMLGMVWFLKWKCEGTPQIQLWLWQKAWTSSWFGHTQGPTGCRCGGGRGCNAGNCCRDAAKIEGPCDAKTVSACFSTHKVKRETQTKSSQTVQGWFSKAAHVVLYVCLISSNQRDVQVFLVDSCQPLGVALSYQRRRAFCSPRARDGSPCRSSLRSLEAIRDGNPCCCRMLSHAVHESPVIHCDWSAFVTAF